MSESKVLFNLKNVHYSILTETQTGGVYTESFATPVAVPGAVSISLSAEDEKVTFNADGIKYWQYISRNGFSGTLEMAKIPDSMLKAIWSYEQDDHQVLFDDSQAQPKYFALGFEIDGDADETKYWFYKCLANPPQIASQTKGDSIEVQTQSLEITCSPSLASGYTYCKSTSSMTGITDWWASVVTHYDTPTT